MAGASDRARFYLEQSVPELRELERKEIFTKVTRLPLIPNHFLIYVSARDFFDHQEALAF